MSEYQRFSRAHCTDTFARAVADSSLAARMESGSLHDEDEHLLIGAEPTNALQPSRSFR